MSSDSEKRCLHISVPPDVCMLWFSDDHIVHSGRLGTSARGEEMGGTVTRRDAFWKSNVPSRRLDTYRQVPRSSEGGQEDAADRTPCRRGSTASWNCFCATSTARK